MNHFNLHSPNLCYHIPTSKQAFVHFTFIFEEFFTHVIQDCIKDWAILMFISYRLKVIFSLKVVY
jgi:hypothetical protein